MPYGTLTVTVDSSGPNPCCTLQGSHGVLSSFSATQNENLLGVPMVSMSVMPGYESPTFIMIRRSARPIDTFTCEMEPGPSAQTPWFMPISSAIGPDTSTIGAWRPVDIAQVRSPIDGSSMHSIIAMITGMVSGLHPAMTALAAILRTVPIPKPGAKSATTWSP